MAGGEQNLLATNRSGDNDLTRSHISYRSAASGTAGAALQPQLQNSGSPPEEIHWSLKGPTFLPSLWCLFYYSALQWSLNCPRKLCSFAESKRLARCLQASEKKGCVFASWFLVGSLACLERRQKQESKSQNLTEGVFLLGGIEIL